MIYAYIRDTWLLRKCYDELITILLLFTVLIFEWVLKFRIWVLTVMIGTCIYGKLVIDGYLCSRVYGKLAYRPSEGVMEQINCIAGSLVHLFDQELWPDL